MLKATKKLSKGMEKLIKSNMLLRLAGAVEEIKAVIIAKYDEELVDVVTDRKSKTNPNLYRDDFIFALLVVRIYQSGFHLLVFFQTQVYSLLHSSLCIYQPYHSLLTQ